MHGATVTPLSRGTAAEARREPEAEAPGKIIDVNVMGTVAMLDWARTLPHLERFIYVSSGPCTSTMARIGRASRCRKMAM